MTIRNLAIERALRMLPAQIRTSRIRRAGRIESVRPRDADTSLSR